MTNLAFDIFAFVAEEIKEISEILDRFDLTQNEFDRFCSEYEDNITYRYTANDAVAITLSEKGSAAYEAHARLLHSDQAVDDANALLEKANAIAAHANELSDAANKLAKGANRRAVWAILIALLSLVVAALTFYYGQAPAT